ncbi:MAG: response regulator transcription factor [Polyangiales bacterium]
MRILIADDDPCFRAYAEETLRERTKHQLTIVDDGVKALEITLSERPDVLVLDWLMPRMNGTQVCRLVRSRLDSPDLYVVFVTGRGRREELLECLNAGADDLLVKPIPPDVLVARIELAAQRMPRKGASRARLRRALELAAEQGDGELVVRGTGSAGRVFFAEGKVALIELDDGSGTFLQDLAVELGWDADTVHGLSEECRGTGAALTEVIDAWGLLEPSRLRTSYQAWLSRKLANILALPDARSLFLPQRRAATGGLLLALDVLWSPEVASGVPPSTDLKATSPSLIPAASWDQAFVRAPNTHRGLDMILDRCAANDGVIGVAALSRASGYCHGSRGRELDPDTAWALLHCVNTVMRIGHVQDSVVTTHAHHHLVRLIPEHDDAFLYVVVDTATTTLAMARLQLQQASKPRPDGA